MITAAEENQAGVLDGKPLYSEQPALYFSHGVGPKFKSPANACDCHIHVFDDRFPTPGSAARLEPNARIEDYQALQKRIGTARTVIVTPRYHLTDNRPILDAIARLGRANARGIAVIHPDITDTELRNLADSGICGVRFTLHNPKVAVTRIDMMEPLARRINEFGWHIQIHMLGDQIVGAENMLRRLAAPVVFDHMGRIPEPAGINHPAFSVISRLIDKGKTWVKLSGPYQESRIGPPDYPDVSKTAQAFIKLAPDRMVWGSDWPHSSEKQKPDDALLFDLLAKWAPDEDTRLRILVHNPAVLYGFPR